MFEEGELVNERFDVVRRIGRGGYGQPVPSSFFDSDSPGEIYYCTDRTQDQKPVALKGLFPVY